MIERFISLFFLLGMIVFILKNPGGFADVVKTAGNTFTTLERGFEGR